VDDDDVEEDEVESPGAISAFVVSSAPETALRILGGVSPLLLADAVEEFPGELLAEELVLSELDDDRRSLGRSGSLSLDELLLLLLLPELLPELVSSELEALRRTGWLLLPDELPVDDPDDESLAEVLADLLDELPEELRPSGCVGSSTASDAAECSSAVPSLTMLIESAW
jgi:hypothetical protein